MSVVDVCFDIIVRGGLRYGVVWRRRIVRLLNSCWLRVFLSCGSGMQVFDERAVITRWLDAGGLHAGDDHSQNIGGLKQGGGNRWI